MTRLLSLRCLDLRLDDLRALLKHGLKQNPKLSQQFRDRWLVVQLAGACSGVVLTPVSQSRGGYPQLKMLRWDLRDWTTGKLFATGARHNRVAVCHPGGMTSPRITATLNPEKQMTSQGREQRPCMPKTPCSKHHSGNQTFLGDCNLRKHALRVGQDDVVHRGGTEVGADTQSWPLGMH